MQIGDLGAVTLIQINAGPGFGPGVSPERVIRGTHCGTCASKHG
jgi:hypothetical protein